MREKEKRENTTTLVPNPLNQTLQWKSNRGISSFERFQVEITTLALSFARTTKFSVYKPPLLSRGTLHCYSVRSAQELDEVTLFSDRLYLARDISHRIFSTVRLRRLYLTRSPDWITQPQRGGKTTMFEKRSLFFGTRRKRETFT